MAKYLDYAGLQRYDGIVERKIEKAINDILPEKTETGNPISISDASGFNAKSAKVTMLPIQDLHGQEAPYPAGGGKNKFPLTINIDDSTYGHTLKLSTYPELANFFSFLQANKGSNAVWSCAVTGEGSNIGMMVVKAEDTTLATYRNGVTQSIPLYDYTTATQVIIYGSTTGATITNCQFELGTTATSYAPYSNICPISGRDSVDLTRMGKNLFNYTTYNTYKQSDGTYRATGYQFQSAGNVLVPQSLVGKTITFSVYIDETKETPYPINLRARANHNGEYILGNAINGTKGISKVTFTPSSGDTISIGVGSGSSNYATIDWFMLEIGEGTDTYEPYQGETYTATFPSTVYGGTDELVSGELTDEFGFATFDNNDNWVNVGGSYPQAFQLDTGITDALQGTAISQQVGYSNLFPWATHDVEQNGIRWQTNSTTVGRLYVYDATHSSDLAGFKEMLRTTPLQVCYKKRTPTEITLTPQSIELNKGVNVITTDGDNAEVKYSVSLDSLVSN